MQNRPVVAGISSNLPFFIGLFTKNHPLGDGFLFLDFLVRRLFAAPRAVFFQLNFALYFALVFA